jgi:hypothetical protein
MAPSRLSTGIALAIALGRAAAAGPQPAPAGWTYLGCYA